MGKYSDLFFILSKQESIFDVLKINALLAVLAECL